MGGAMNASVVKSVLPCVVQVGFAGSRQLFDQPATGTLNDLNERAEAMLVKELDSLPQELCLGPHHFLVGISQVAVGADTLFTRACKKRKIPQRIFLPQPSDAYLSAVGSHGPDFSEAEREKAIELLNSEHIIQERVVSNANDRGLRFEECNCEIARVSDVLICLVSAGATCGRGGTGDLLNLARASEKRVLEIRVSEVDGEVRFDRKWHESKNKPFLPPSLPAAIRELEIQLPDAIDGIRSLPTVVEYAGVIKGKASVEARKHNVRFSRFALIIILTHVLATLCAALALAVHGISEAASPWIVMFLEVELVLLISGAWYHDHLHHQKPAEQWAEYRLLAEICRSMPSLSKLHMYLSYVFNLQLPASMRPLLRTLSALHLRTTRAYADTSVETLREAYLEQRLTDPSPKKGQLAYYQERLAKEKRYLKCATFSFTLCSCLAMAATAMKLLMVVDIIRISDEGGKIWTACFGTLAIFLPTLAVGALSWAAAKEYKARAITYEAMVQFLKDQINKISHAASRRELQSLVHETEAHLLSETVEWHTRRVVNDLPH